MEESRRRYFLALHVYLGITDDHAILLDLRRDKYIGVSCTQMAILAESVAGWPAPADPLGGAAGRQLLDKMLADGVLTLDPAAGKNASVLQMKHLEHALTQPTLEGKVRIHARQVVSLLWASAAATVQLRWRSIEAVVERVRRRKQRRSARSSALDPEIARPLVEAFFHLRPLLFGARNHCLFDSLVMVEFLALYSLFPTWVFGVQTGPFAAHCWVQEGAVVFNDTPDYVRRFTPILAV